MATLTYQFIKKVDPEYRKHLILMPSGRRLDEKVCLNSEKTCVRNYCIAWDPSRDDCSLSRVQDRFVTAKEQRRREDYF